MKILKRPKNWVFDVYLYSWNPLTRISFESSFECIFDAENSFNDPGLFINIKFICVELVLKFFVDRTIHLNENGEPID